MKVFLPGQILRVSTYWSPHFGNLLFGIPLEGEWVEVPSYFRQLTEGNEENDVIHAKLVDHQDFDYSVFDCNVKIDRRDYLFQQTSFIGATYRDFLVRNIAKRKSLRFGSDVDGHPTFIVNEYRFSFHLGGYVKKYDGKACYLPSIYLYVPYEGRRYFSLHVATYSNRPEWAVAPISQEFLALWDLWYQDVRDYPKVISKQLWDDPDWYDQIVQLSRLFEDFVIEHYEEFYNFLLAEVAPTTGTVYVPSAIDFVDNNPRTAFLLDEDTVIAEGLDPMLLGAKGGFNSYWRNYLIQHAFLAACNNLPTLNDNSISNIIEIVGFIKSLVMDGKVEIPSSLADAWLQYRYVYTTSKLDIAEAIKFVERHLDLGTLDRDIDCRGTSSHIFEDGTSVTCRCKIRMSPAHLSKLREIWRALCTYGLAPDFYVIWDMVPYSFIVDWFLPVSDILSVWDASHLYNNATYNFKVIQYSFNYIRVINGMHFRCYTRWTGSCPPELRSYYWLEKPTASQRTVGYRILDVASLSLS